MKRNWEVTVELLQQLEDLPAGPNAGWHPHVERATKEEVVEHLLLLKEDGLVEVEIQHHPSGRWRTLDARLRNDGHDFLEAMRTPKRRQKMREWAESIGKTLTPQLLLEYLRTL